MPPRALLLFDFIVAYKTAHDGASPSTRTIATDFHLFYGSSSSVIHYNLKALARAGLIVRTRKHCEIQVVGGSWTYTKPEPNGSPHLDSQESRDEI